MLWVWSISVAGAVALEMSMDWHVQAMAGTSSGWRLRQQQEAPSGRSQSTGQVCSCQKTDLSVGVHLAGGTAYCGHLQLKEGHMRSCLTPCRNGGQHLAG